MGGREGAIAADGPRRTRARLAWLFACGLLLGGTGFVVPPLGFAPLTLVVLRLVVGILAASLCRVAAAAWAQGGHSGGHPTGRTVLAATFCLCLLTGALAGTVWPVSGDEYSDVTLADTLASGHYATPSPLPLKLFGTFHLLDDHGWRFSEYSPGWPLFLAPFRAAGLDALAPALLAVGLGLALRSAMRRLSVPAATEGPALALVLLTPFALFNGASMFPHMLAAALSAAIVAWQLADEDRPAVWRKLGVGFAFGWLFLTRHEAAAVLGIAYAADRLWFRRGRGIGELALVGLGALPWLAWQAQYDEVLTGHALVEPLLLGAAKVRLGLWGVGYDGAHSPLRAALYFMEWSASLAAYGGWLVAALLPAAFAARLLGKRLRFFDAAFPLTVLFFVFYPDNGWHQYGPRYWFATWPLALLTVTTGLAGSDGLPSLGGRPMSWQGLAVGQAALAAGAWLMLVPSVRSYVEARRAVFEVRPDVLPAIVLVPQWRIAGGLWADDTRRQDAADFTRNAPGLGAPVLYALGDLPESVGLACGIGWRAVFRWEADGVLRRVACAR